MARSVIGAHLYAECGDPEFELVKFEVQASA
jgi:hypothetical protein